MSPQKTMCECGMNGKCCSEPGELRIEGGGYLHSSGGDEDLILLLQRRKDARRVRHHVEIGEEVFGMKVVVKDGMVMLRNNLPEALAEQVSLGERSILVAVIAEEVFGDGVSHHFIHVDADALGSGFHLLLLSRMCSRKIFGGGASERAVQ